MTTSSLLPLGALAAGFGLAGAAFAQVSASPAPTTAPTAATDTVLPVVRAKVTAEPTGKESVQATTTRIGKGQQDLRDVPQSVTVVTERLIDDRNLDTLKEALKNTAGISFQAAEGGEEDIRLRGFSLQAAGDIFVDGVRDPAFYERDSFNWDRLELLRGSASMLFGRGSTGGAANQVSKEPRLLTQHEVSATLGSGSYVRGTGDFNLRTGESSALRINAMANVADNYGAKIDKKGIAPSFRWGIGTADEFLVGLYHLDNNNGINYGLPWLAPTAGSADRVLLPVSPRNYYGMASDFSKSTATLGTLSWTHRFADRSELKTTLRAGDYTRDLRASAIRICARGTTTNLDCPPAGSVTAETINDATILTRGTNVKVQDMKTLYAQSDYSARFNAWGLRHEVLAGVDVADEDFTNYALSVPAGTTLTKPRTTVGTPNDGASINEALRIATVNRTFDAQGAGVYAQDLLQVAPAWKLLAGLRFDRFEGSYKNVNIAPPAATNPCTVPIAASVSRSDSLLSQRLGVLYQPSPTQSYHFSYGTSFNTAGDAYQFDAGNASVDPERSRNFELGAKLEFAEGNLSTRLALFHATKYNERNRDADSVNACNYVLSGQRHAAGLEIDIAGRITPEWEVFASYAYIPDAKIDAASPAAAAGETVGARPGLTPRHTGTLWSTYKLAQKWRVGGGINARGRDVPQGITTFSAPRYVTADLMGEYAWDNLALRVNLTNITDKLYADYLYRGHYVAGKPRTFQFTVTSKF